MILRPDFGPGARRLGISAAAGLVLLSLGYAVVLIGGLRSLQSPQQPIAGRYFAAMELLILLVAPCAVVLMVAVHAWAPPESKVYSLTAVVFMALLAAVTCSVHFVILTAGARVAAADPAGAALFLSFRWPSVAYALDILAWDVFYALAMLFAAPAIRGGRLAAAIRILMVTSGVLALAGLSAVVTDDMQLRMDRHRRVHGRAPRGRFAARGPVRADGACRSDPDHGVMATFMTPSRRPPNSSYAALMSASLKRCVSRGRRSSLPLRTISMSRRIRSFPPGQSVVTMR